MFVLAGPNGAGKSTLYHVMLEPRLGPDVPFINADVIQKTELRIQSMQGAYRAAEVAEQRRRELMAQRRSFVTESTFSHESKLRLVDDALEAGYRVEVIHIGVRDPLLSVERVASRVLHGGHDVPVDKIVERFERNQPLIRSAVLRAHRGRVFDNSVLGRAPQLQLEFSRGRLARVGDEVEPWVAALYHRELDRSVSRERAQPTQSSLAEAGSLGTKLAGRGGVTQLPHDTSVFYQGPIVGETSRHWLQQHDTARFTAHDKTHLAGHDVALGDSVRVIYVGPAHALVEPFDGYPPRSTDTPDGTQRREAFHTLARSDAVHAHPELAAAYAALDQLLARADEGADALTPTQSKKLEVMLRQRIGDALASGQTFTAAAKPARRPSTARKRAQPRTPTGRKPSMRKQPAPKPPARKAPPVRKPSPRKR